MLSTFWSGWVIFISVLCLVVLVAFLIFVLKMKVHLAPDGTTGIDYGGIREYDKPMPRWWVISFWLTIVWGCLYLFFYPALGTYKGAVRIEHPDGKKTEWTSGQEVSNDLARNQQVFLSYYQKNFGGQSIEQLSQNRNAVKVGQTLFAQNCALCHGINARGGYGFPNLTDRDWLYGGTTSDIHTSITNGRAGQMPAWQDQIGEENVQNVAEYVLSLSNRRFLDKSKVSAGSKIYTSNCAVCHTAAGTGDQKIGSPNLTDNIWLYGGSRPQVQATIRNGHKGMMPSWGPILGDERINLISAYVYSLSNK